jgi:large subunit ribosomal protein L2
MGKTLIQQARGHGSLSYRVKHSTFFLKPEYLSDFVDGEEFEVVRLISPMSHTAPIAKFKQVNGGKTFHNLAISGMFEGQKIKIGGKNPGDIIKIGELENGTEIFNIEINPQDGGKLVRTGGNSAVIIGKEGTTITIRLPSKCEKKLKGNCRATIGKTAGSGRLDKPILKAGKQHFIKKSKSRLWPRTSAVKMNAIDHPFGSGRAKRIKSKIAKRNAPPGAKVGHLRPRRTGRTKR